MPGLRIGKRRSARRSTIIRRRLLPADDAEVAKDIKKITEGRELSPILLVRGDLRRDRALQIADGYHRVCAGYHVDENTAIPCRLVDLPSPAEQQGCGSLA